MTADVTNYFIQALMPKIKDDKEKLTKHIIEVLVDMLVKIDPVLYGPNVVYDHGIKDLYVQLIWAIYGIS